MPARKEAGKQTTQIPEVLNPPPAQSVHDGEVCLSLSDAGKRAGLSDSSTSTVGRAHSTGQTQLSKAGTVLGVMVREYQLNVNVQKVP
jgi:hypothetical protein